jgi:hypothetical protein
LLALTTPEKANSGTTVNVTVKASSRDLGAIHLFPSSDDGKEHVEGDLDAVEEEQTVFVGNKLEIDGMHNWPDLPRTLASSKKITLEFVPNHCKGVAVAQSKVGEENCHKDGAPTDLVNGNL